MAARVKDGAASRSPERELFHRYLQEQGLKCTEQRDHILDALVATGTHITAEELYLKVRSIHQGIGFSTVYRTLRLLRECGLAREVDLADGRTYFEQHYDTPHHDHLVCTSCGTMAEFADATIESRQDEVARTQGFVPTHHTMVIYGVCSDCQAGEGES